jgi:hypothetical protein
MTNIIFQDYLISKISEIDQETINKISKVIEYTNKNLLHPYKRGYEPVEKLVKKKR